MGGMFVHLPQMIVPLREVREALEPRHFRKDSMKEKSLSRPCYWMYHTANDNKVCVCPVAQ